jgi:spermidine/putrescine transport system substrate-binding protein
LTGCSDIKRVLQQLEGGAIPRREFAQWILGMGLSLGGFSFWLQACQRGSEREDSSAELGPIEKELHIYNWSDYVAEDTVPNFEREFGVKVRYDTYESNEEMVAKLQAGATGYDIVVPSSYIVPLMVATNLLAPLRRKYLTNFGNLSPIFQNLESDPGNRYTVPWQWGTSGIAYRTDKVKTPVESWAVFQEAQYAGKMTMMDDGREVIGSQLRYRGHSLNSSDSNQLAQAKTDAISAKRQLRAYISAPVKAQLIAGDVWIAQLWNGDTAQARMEQPKLRYVVPREGCTIWADSLCIPRNAPNKRAAHEWMNYVLRPEVGAALSQATGYGTPNAAAARLMKSPVPYPTDAELKRLEYQVDLGENSAVWDQIWTEIKSA